MTLYHIAGNPARNNCVVKNKHKKIKNKKTDITPVARDHVPDSHATVIHTTTNTTQRTLLTEDETLAFSAPDGCVIRCVYVGRM